MKPISWGIFTGSLLLAAGLWQAQAEQKPSREAGTKGDAALLKHGEYLVNEVAHCSHCHTPRDAKGRPDRSRLLQGASLPIRPKEKTDEWADESPDITRGGLAGKWGEEKMIKFLTTGLNPDGKKPTPPMPVFRLHERDARAVALYLKSLPGKKGERRKE